MPFQSEKQRRYLWANEPEIARDWTDTYGSRIKKDEGGITNPRLLPHTGADLLVKNTATGERPKYQPPGGGETSLGSGAAHSGGASDRGPRDDLDRHGPKTTPTPSGDGPGNIHGGPTVKEALKVGKRKKELRDLAKKAAEDKREQKVEVFRAKNFNSPMNKLARMSLLNNIFGPLNHRDFFIDEVLGKGHYGELTEEEFYGMSPAEQEKALRSYNRARGMGEIDAYGRTITNQGGDGQRGGYMGYPSYEAWKAAQGTGATAATPAAPVSAFQQSLTAGANTPNYYVGENPLASNIAWGQQMGVDPRTMGLTSWAAEGGRIPRAFGGIMDSSTGRRAYGLGSIFKKIGRAAKKVFKSPIGRAALIGGLGFGANAGWFSKMGMGNMGKGWVGSLKTLAQNKPWLGKMLLNKDNNYSLGKLGIMGAGALPLLGFGQPDEDEDDKFDYEGAKNKYWDELRRIKAGALAGTLDPNKFVYQGVKDGGRIGLSNGGDPMLVEEYKKYVFEMEEQGLQPMSFEQFKEQARAGMYAGGQSTPSDYTMEDARMMTTQDKLGGITDVMKQADLHRQGSVGQFYAADGGRIGYAGGSGKPPITMGQVPPAPPQMPAQPPQRPHPMPAPQPNRMAGMPGGMNPMGGGMHPMMGGMHLMMNRPMMRGNPKMGARRMAQEGGLMDLGGMEKDYRQEGGFVPLGGEEKADDVPARLSKNEFVFTADAVRGAGDGDIDKGAEIMENVMKNLEQGGQISEKTQGLSGAQEMFGVSERLSEVV